jgi:hypothetical protein
VAASLAYHAQLPQARSLARVTIEQLASDALAGDLEIGRVDELGLGRARFTEVVLRDDQRRLVISIPELTVWPDLRALFDEDARVRIAGAHARRPFVRLYTVDDIGGPDPEGLEVSLVRAFQPASRCTSCSRTCSSSTPPSSATRPASRTSSSRSSTSSVASRLTKPSSSRSSMRTGA